MCCDYRQKIIHRLLIGTACLCYVASHHLAVGPKSGAKDYFYCTVHYITLYSNCEAQGVSKNLKKL
jgi:hypothetical protein